jgi:hypothetical protein
MKIEDLWHHLSSYVFYFASIIIALFVDVVVSLITVIFHLPVNLSETNLKEFMLKGSVDTMQKEEFAIRVVDGHMLLWDISMTEVLQIGVLAITFIATLIKAYIDLHNFFKNKEKNTTVKKRFGRIKRGE